MKTKLILTALFLCSIGMVKAQTAKKRKLLSVDTTHWIIDKTQPIYSIQITGDTARLKPLDTTYSANEGLAFMTIRYSFKEDKKDMQMKITSFYNGKYWSFRSIEVKTIPNLGTLSIGYPMFSTPNYQIH